MKNVAYFETSAKYGSGVTEAFASVSSYVVGKTGEISTENSWEEEEKLSLMTELPVEKADSKCCN